MANMWKNIVSLIIFGAIVFIFFFLAAGITTLKTKVSVLETQIESMEKETQQLEELLELYRRTEGENNE